MAIPTTPTGTPQIAERSLQGVPRPLAQPCIGSKGCFANIFLHPFMYQKPEFIITEVKLNMDWKKIGFGASLVSIVASIGIYFNGDESLGIFVGLWASALLLLTDRLAEMQAE
jgi:hypothetical protein